MIDMTALALYSQTLDGIEDLRIATENRNRMLTRDEPDSDGVIRGRGGHVDDKVLSTAAGMLEGIEKLENDARLALSRELRKSPFAAWQKSRKGIGEKQAARLLGVIGDPYWNTLHDRPRTVSELWSYCGYSVDGGSAVRRRKGEVANWSKVAKSRAFLMAESCVKQLTGEYRAVYDDARAKYADAVHPVDCARCGPKGKPALVGSPLSLGHQHARALRIIAKEILRDLWIVAKDHNENGEAV